MSRYNHTYSHADTSRAAACLRIDSLENSKNSCGALRAHVEFDRVHIHNLHVGNVRICICFCTSYERIDFEVQKRRRATAARMIVDIVSFCSETVTPTCKTH